MLLDTITYIVALFAINGQGYELPDRFIDGMERKGEPVIESTFVGQRWDCGDETCFAGLAYRDAEWLLHTGP